MNEQQLNTVAQLRAFLDGTQEVRFEPQGEDSWRYAFIAAAVRRLRYGRLPRTDKGVVMRYLECTTGYSWQQVTHLVKRARHGGILANRYTAPTPGFARKVTAADVVLLAETDALHGALSGLATRCPCNAPSRSSETPAMIAFPRFRSPTSITCARPEAARRAGGTGPKTPGPRCPDCRSSRSAPRPPSGLPPHRFRAPGRSGQGEGALLHQCGRLCHAI